MYEVHIILNIVPVIMFLAIADPALCGRTNAMRVSIPQVLFSVEEEGYTSLMRRTCCPTRIASRAGAEMFITESPYGISWYIAALPPVLLSST